MIKKITAFLAILLLLSPAVTVQAESCVSGECCETVNEIMDETAQNWRNMSQDVFEEYIHEPDPSAIQECLDVIDSVSMGFSFSMPSVDSLLGAACDFVVAQAKSKLNEATGNITGRYSYDAGYGFGGSGSSQYGADELEGPDFQVNDNSDETVDAIWEAIK